MIPKEITRDLQSGMSLEETLIKHNTNLKILFQKEKEGFYEVMKYIEKRGNHYYIKKKIMNRTYYFGTYATLEDAQRVRDQLMLCDWKQNQVDRICRGLGVERIISKNERRYSDES